MIREAIHDYASKQRRVFSDDRYHTVGASEVGSCVRKTWFSKAEGGENETPRDADYEDTWGAAYRGTVMEERLWVPAMRKWAFANGAQLLYAGNEQQTFRSGWLSATPDGVLVLKSGEELLLDCKSIDPRVNLQEPKPVHVMQVIAGMGVLHSIGKHAPKRAILSYIDASFWDKVTEYEVAFDETVYATLRSRAADVMTSKEAFDLLPEGKIAGGKECEYCPWASQCGLAQLGAIPKGEAAALSANVAAVVDTLAGEIKALGKAETAAGVEIGKRKEELKRLMAELGTRRLKTERSNVSWAEVKGRTSLDADGLKAAAKAAGVDVAPFMTVGNGSERLTVTSNAKEDP